MQPSRLKAAYRKDLHICSDRMWGNGSKLKESGFRLAIRKKSFSVRVVRHCNKLLREVVDALHL